MAFQTEISLELSGIANVDALVTQYRWIVPTITYGFPTSPAQYDYALPPGVVFYTLNPSHQAQVAAVFAQISTFCLLQFEQSADPAAAMIRVGGNDQGTYANYPWAETIEGTTYNTPGQAGDIMSDDSNEFFTGTGPGSVIYDVFMHEIGHSLGLSHTHEGSGHPPVDLEHDYSAYSVMSANSSTDDDPNTFVQRLEDGFMPQSYMMYDIAALQLKYGANFAYNSGDSVYRWNPATGQMSINGVGQVDGVLNYIFMTIWDGGGIDTYDLSNYGGGVTVDLRPGEWTTASSAQLPQIGGGSPDLPPIFPIFYPPGNIANALLYQGDTRSLIENAVGGAGNDTIIGNVVANRLTGGLGADVLTGGLGSDTFVFRAGDGKDVVTDLAAGDKVEITGYTSASSITQVGSNVVVAFSGSDQITFSNTIVATVQAALSLTAPPTSGNVIRGTAGADNLIGTSADNQIFGEGGNDTLSGGAGNDMLDGGTGADAMAGGSGNDIYYVDNAGDKTTEGSLNSGIDEVRTTIGLTLAANVENAVAQGTAAINLTGNTAANKLTGNGGANSLNGGSGNDVLKGEAGADTIEGGAGTDSLFGGSDVDTFVYRSGAGLDTIADFAAGETISVYGYAAAQSVAQSGANVVVTFASGSQITVLNSTVATVTAALKFNGGTTPPTGGSTAPTAGDDTLTGTDAANNISGLGGNDKIYGLGGNDTLNGGTGNDLLDGGAGADSLVGGAGNDIMIVDDAGDKITEGNFGGGTDQVIALANYTLGATAYVEKMTASGASAFNLTGNNLAQSITGNDLNNILSGLGGNDVLVGAGGSDALIGGAGSDTLTGGAGNDRFVYQGASIGNDRIADFQKGTDKIDLDAYDLAMSNVKISSSNGNTLVAVDSNRDGGSDFMITLVGVTGVSESDFILG